MNSELQTDPRRAQGFRAEARLEHETHAPWWVEVGLFLIFGGLTAFLCWQVWLGAQQ